MKVILLEFSKADLCEVTSSYPPIFPTVRF